MYSKTLNTNACENNITKYTTHYIRVNNMLRVPEISEYKTRFNGGKYVNYIRYR